MQFIGVASRANENDMALFIDEFGFDFPNMNDGSGSVWAAFGVTNQPAFVFISADGSTETILSGLSDSEILSRVEELAAS